MLLQPAYISLWKAATPLSASEHADFLTTVSLQQLLGPFNHSMPDLYVSRQESAAEENASHCCMQVADPVNFTTSWLTAHIANAQSLGKPFIVEEFGKSINARDANTISTVRDPVFTAVYNMLNSNLKADGIFKGMLQINTFESSVRQTTAT